MQYTLSKAVQFDGQEISELDLNFSRLNKINFDEAMAEFKLLNPNYAGEITLSMKFTKFIIAKLINKPYILLDQLSAPDFTAMRFFYLQELQRVKTEALKLDLSLDKFSVLDLEYCEEQFKYNNPNWYGGVAETEPGFIDEVLLRASKLTLKELNELSFGVYLKTYDEVSSFLLNTFVSAASNSTKSHV